MISILLHRQNLNLVIFGWTELLILKDFVIWCKDRCWHWHEQFHWYTCYSYVTTISPLRKQSSVEKQARSSQQRVCCCMDQEAEAWIKVSSLWHAKCPRWGEGKGKSHTQKHGTHGARTPGWYSGCGHWYSYGAAFLLINRIPLVINKPAVFVFLLLSGI